VIDVPPDRYIGGERVASAENVRRSLPDRRASAGPGRRRGPIEASRAVAAAEEAFPGWAALGPAGRALHLRRLGDLIDASIEPIAEVECLDMAMLLRSLCPKVIGRARATSARRRGARGPRLVVERDREPGSSAARAALPS